MPFQLIPVSGLRVERRSDAPESEASPSHEALSGRVWVAKGDVERHSVA